MLYKGDKMKDKKLQQYAAEVTKKLPKAELTFPFGEDWDVYKVCDKVFMLQTSITGAPIVIIKSDPEEAEYLRQKYPDITEGYHMNKRHWITLHPNGGLDANLVEELVAKYYLLIVKGLPKKQQPVNPTTFSIS